MHHKCCDVTNVQSSRNLAQMIMLNNYYWTDFKFKNVWPIKFDREAAKQKVSQFLCSPLTYYNQTRYIDPWHHQGYTQWIWLPLTTRGRCNEWICAFNSSLIYFKLIFNVWSYCQTSPYSYWIISHGNIRFGRHVESCQNKYYISTGPKFCPIFMKLAIYDLQTKLNTWVK